MGATGSRGIALARRGLALLGAVIVVACTTPDDGPAMTPTPAPAKAASPTDDAAGGSKAAVTDDARAHRLAELRARYDADARAMIADPTAFTAVASELRAMTNEAGDRHLRANAALLLGALHQERGSWADAAGAYRRAAELIDDDAGPQMALARALAQAGDLPAAVIAQQKAVELDRDNLEQYLALGELRLRAGDKPGSADAYAQYEIRRKGLIDGLTLKTGTAYRVSVDDRVGCAEALAAATDVGTAFALLYALDTDPEPRVREAVARAMGVQRLDGYKPRLVKELADETDPTVREALGWAIAEIDRDPVHLEQEIPSEAPPTPPAPEGEAPAAPTPTGDRPPGATAGGAGGTDPPPPDR